MSIQNVRHEDIVPGFVLPVVLMGEDGAITLGVDDITGALTTILAPHHEVHEGEMFSASFYNGTLADDAAISMLLVGPVIVTGHLVFEVACGGNAEVEFFSGTNTSDPGAALLEANMNRTVANPAAIVATSNPTIVDDGTRILHKLVPGGTGGNATGGTIRENTEWIIAGAVQYLIRLTNRGGAAKPASIVSQWYEEPA